MTPSFIIYFDLTGMHFAFPRVGGVYPVKDYLINFVSILICLHGIAWHTTGRKGPKAKDIVAVFSAQHANTLPHKLAEAPVTDLFVSPQALQFTLDKKLIFRVRWIGERSRMLSFNGKIFSGRELESYDAFVKALHAKFGLQKKDMFAQALVTSTRFQASVDSTQTQADLDDPVKEEEKSQGRDQITIEGDNSFKKYILGTHLFTEKASLADTEIGRQFALTYDVMTGDNQMAMVKFAYNFLGGLSFAMNPAGGFKPGLEFINDLGPSPASVPWPY